jgi:hypothetical protein
MILHGVILKPQYEAQKELFLPQDQMRIPLLMLVVLTHAAVFVKIYAWLVSPKSILSGVLYGLLWGIGHGVGMGYGMYATMPIPPSMAGTMCLGAIVQAILGGIAVGLIVRKRDEPPP